MHGSTEAMKISLFFREVTGYIYPILVVPSATCSTMGFRKGTYNLRRRTQRCRSSIKGIEHGCGRLLVIPVGTPDNNGLISNALAIETEVIGGESTVGIDDFAKIVEDGFIVTSESARVTSQIFTEATTVAVELLKDDDLSFYVAYLFRDDSGERCPMG